MREINSTDFKNQFGECLDMSRKAPIIVRKSGKPVAVMMSMAEFEHFQRLEDLYWVARAEAAEVSGEWVSHEQAVKLLTERLKQGQ